MWDDEPEVEGGGDTFVPVAGGEVAVDAPADAQAGEMIAVEGDVIPPAEIQPNIPVEVEKRKSRVSIHWKRPKSHLYEYNYDYGSNYYKGMIDYLDERSSGYKPAPPKALNWAERALKTYSEKREAAARNKDKDQDAQLLHTIRNSVNSYTVHARTYTRKVTASLTY